ncbi:unnamed protein product [Protopolystoma xenopodis]|uniref:Uncharacterized protein n=1 Tax=Protopolystoma xenopodis TaxID=117903 RepID=A0A448WPE0_9PLAT|nr:unnamed protein product [Protopolystoma xenopodis]
MALLASSKPRPASTGCMAAQATGRLRRQQNAANRCGATQAEPICSDHVMDPAIIRFASDAVGRWLSHRGSDNSSSLRVTFHTATIHLSCQPFAHSAFDPMRSQFDQPINRFRWPLIRADDRVAWAPYSASSARLPTHRLAIVAE